MTDELRLDTITREEANAMTRPFELDLEAVFRAMRQEAVLLVRRGVREGWTPEQLIENLGALVTEPGFHAEESERIEVLRDLTALLGGLVVGKAVEIGEVVRFGDYLFRRTKKTDGKWHDYEKLGRAPEGWKKGDPLPEELAGEEAEDTAGEQRRAIPDPPDDPDEAAAYMEQHIGWKLALHPANQVAGPMLARIAHGYVKEFRGLRGFITAIGDAKQVQAVIGGKIGESPLTLAAVHYGPEFKGLGLTVNFRHYTSDPAKWQAHLKKSVQNGFAPQGTGTLKAIIDHEMGHVITKAIHARDPELRKLWQGVGGQEKGAANPDLCRNHLSAYAATNIGEFISEGWAEYRNNPQPRPLARAIGERMSYLLERKTRLVEFLAPKIALPGKTDSEIRAMLWAARLEDLEKMGEAP